MGKLVMFGKAAVVIRAHDHNPPHFHVIGPDFDALITIDPLAILRGTLPRSVLDQVLGWAAENRERLVVEWNRINPEYRM